MDREPSSDKGDELETLETKSSSTSTTCPTCGRAVEPGFKFCDYCGTKLEAGPMRTGTPERQAPHEDTSPSLFERLRRRRRKEPDDVASALAKDMKPPEEAMPLPPVEDITPPPAQPPAPSSPTPGTMPPPPAVSAPPNVAPPRPRSQLTKAEDLKAATSEGRAGISGRLRWNEPTTSARPDAARAEEIKSSWRPIGAPSVAAPARGFGPRDVLVFVFHLAISFIVGAALVGLAAVVASLMSDGRVAMLEVRGLPIFIAGASAIIIFALLRTGPRARLTPRAVAISVIVGFLVLVTAVAILYQPSLMADAQSRLDRALGVFGDDVVQGVDRFEADVDQWNAEVHQYSEVELQKLSTARDKETDAAKLAKAEEAFRIAASGSEEALDGVLKRMRSHADGVRHAPLKDALTDLTGIFADELSGIHLITRGFVNDDQALIQSGDTRFKDATQRAVEFFEDRVRPILERGEIDADSLALAIEDLRG
jgi:hypothetical protein